MHHLLFLYDSVSLSHFQLELSMFNGLFTLASKPCGQQGEGQPGNDRVISTACMGSNKSWTKWDLLVTVLRPGVTH